MLWGLIAAVVVAAAAGAFAGDRLQVSVKWVADGDTVLLSDGRWIRYIGINTPEVATKDHHGEPLARAARQRNRELIGQHPINLEFDRSRNDRYGRILAYVTSHEGRMINEALVADGLAYCLPIKPNGRHTQRLLAAQRSAMAARRGLWALLQDRNAPVTGNRKSLRFHQPDCPMAKRMSPGNRFVLPSVTAAFRAGYAPAKECLPVSVVFSK